MSLLSHVVVAADTPDTGGGLCSVPVIRTGCGAAADAVGSVANSAAQTFVDGFADGFATLVKTMLTFWVDVPTPTLSGAGGPVAQLQGLVYEIQGVILVASLLYVAAKMALDRSGAAAASGAKAMGVMILAVGAGATGIDILTKFGDEWSQWIIDSSANGDMGTRLAVVTGGSTTLGAFGIGLEFLISIVGIFSCIAQIFLLLARVGILTLLVGTLPLSAAGLATPAGRAWFTRIVGWIIAFVLYKPAAALVYAAAFTLTGSGTDLTSVLSGLMLIILSVFALPALMRLVAPMVAAASGSGGGALGGALAGASLATGARQVPAPRSSRSSGDGTGQAGLSGSSSGTDGSAPSGASSAGSAGGASAGAGAGGASAGAAGGSAGAAGGAAGAAGGAVGVAVVGGAQLAKAGYDASKNAAEGAADGAGAGSA